MSRSPAPNHRAKLNLRLSHGEVRTVRASQLAVALLAPRKDLDLVASPEAALPSAASVIRAGLWCLAGEIAEAMKNDGKVSPRLAGALKAAWSPMVPE